MATEEVLEDLKLEHLATVHAQLRPPLEVGPGPAGTRLVFEVESGSAEGKRLRAEMAGVAAADWLTVGPDGTGTLDVRITMRTDDSALIYGHYYGRTDLSGGLSFPATLYVAPQFETADPRYAWLNKVQAVGKGVVQPDLSLEYDWYELR